MNQFKSIWDSYKNVPTEQLLKEPGGKTQRKEFVELLLKYFELKGKSVLEVGTGTGMYSIELAKQEAMCTGIDIEHGSIDLARRIAKDCDSTAGFQKCDLFEVSKNNHYDIVFSMGTVEHFTDEEIIAMFKKMSEIGDYVIVGVPYRGSHAYMFAKEISIQVGTWEYGIENDFMSLESLFKRSGLEIIDEKIIGSVAEAMFLKRINTALIDIQIAINNKKLNEGKEVGSSLIAIGKKREENS